MSLWTDLVAEVIAVTNRPDLTAEIDLGLRQALRTAHKSAKFWRDLAVVPVTGLALDALQQIPIAANLPQFRQAIYVKSNVTDKFYDPVDITDLVDSYGALKLNTYYGVGTTINIRSSAPEDAYEIAYYKYPIVSPKDNMDSWIATDYGDLLVALTGSLVLGMVGEQEIKATLDKFVAIGMQDLISDNLEIQGR